MKVNEKIQYFRKKAGLSQDELGKRLLVSRQTVSLWETGQTLPTLDNLTRLREIFEVSIDELLLEDEDEACKISDKNEIKPYENYTFSYSEEDIKKINRSVFLPNCVLFLFFFMMLVGGVIAVILTPKLYFEHGFMLCASFLMTVLTVFLPISVVKDARLMKKERLVTEYILEVFGDRFTFGKRIDGVLYDLKTVLYSEIKNIACGKTFLTVYVGHVIYNFKRDLLPQNSLLYSSDIRNSDGQSGSRRMKKASLVFFVITLIFNLAFPITAATVMFSPLPVAVVIAVVIMLVSLISVVLGIVVNFKGRGGTKSIISGIISLFLILVISVSFIGLGKYSPLEDAEYYIGIDLPENYSGMNISVVEEYFDNSYVYYIAEYYFDDEEVSNFEFNIEKDSRWLSYDEAKELLALCPENIHYQGAEYFLFYEFTTESVNRLPENDEYVSYIFISYFVEENMMIVNEYDCNN